MKFSLFTSRLHFYMHTPYMRAGGSDIRGQVTMAPSNAFQSRRNATCTPCGTVGPSCSPDTESSRECVWNMLSSDLWGSDHKNINWFSWKPPCIVRYSENFSFHFRILWKVRHRNIKIRISLMGGLWVGHSLFRWGIIIGTRTQLLPTRKCFSIAMHLRWLIAGESGQNLWERCSGRWGALKFGT